MLPRHHRRRHTMIGEQDRQKPKLIMRVMAAAVVLFIVWYIVARILAYFDSTIGRKTAALLTVRSGDSVEVSLQGGDWQRAETNLKLYAGDSIAVRGNSDAILTFFDGTQIRLDRGSELSVNDSDELPESTSLLGVKVTTGRIWVATPMISTFTGSIAREIETSNYVASVPPESQALLSASLVNVVRASNVGVRLHFTIPNVQAPDIYIGEGQYFNLNEDTKSQLLNGKDPYSFRDPVTQELLKDEFLISSYAYFTSPGTITSQPEGGEIRVPVGEDLTLITPEDRAKISTKSVQVSGKVSERVSTVRLNGQNVVINQSRSFSVDLNLTAEKTMAIKVEAVDKQGITLASVERVVSNAFEVKVEPVRIVSPVGSGETLSTSLEEIEITGVAPAGTKSVIVNDYTLQLFKAGSKTWSYLASAKLGNLLSGKNVFSVVAVDADGNRSPSRAIVIDYTPTENTQSGSSISEDNSSTNPPLKQNPPLEPGSLKVSAPVNGTSAEIADKEVVIEGTTSPATHSISINGYTLSLYLPGKTTWNYIASTDLQTMKRGKNIYRIVTRNVTGEILDVLEYTITYSP